MKKRNTVPEHFQFAIIAADVVMFTIRDNKLLVRLTKVQRPPHFSNSRGMPGGLIDPKETAEEAAKRLVRTKGLLDAREIYIEQLYTFSELKRDPRGRVVAVAYRTHTVGKTLYERTT